MTFDFETVMTVSDVARSLGWSYTGVRQAWKSGRIAPAALTVGGAPLFRTDEVERFRQVVVFAGRCGIGPASETRPVLDVSKCALRERS